MFKVEKEECWDLRVKWWNLTKENAMKLSERITEEGAWWQIEGAEKM